MSPKNRTKVIYWGCIIGLNSGIIYSALLGHSSPYRRHNTMCPDLIVSCDFLLECPPQEKLKQQKISIFMNLCDYRCWGGPTDFPSLLVLDVVVVDDMMMIITIKDLFRCPRPKNRNQSTADAIPIVAVEELQ